MHIVDLLPALDQPEIWKWMSIRPERRADLEEVVEAALEAERSGKSLAFAVIDISSGRAVGSTRYLDIDDKHRSVEIGSTWYLPSRWGSSVNPETKLLLLRHAFEEWGANRVFFKADALNTRSRRAIEKLGAFPEGVLRNHMVRRDGSHRDSAYYSILPSEWPAVRKQLEARLATLIGR